MTYGSRQVGRVPNSTLESRPWRDFPALLEIGTSIDPASSDSRATRALWQPRGRLGESYMALIRPFRYLVVYPALMRQLEREWSRRGRISTEAGPASDPSSRASRRRS